MIKLLTERSVMTALVIACMRNVLLWSVSCFSGLLSGETCKGLMLPSLSLLELLAGGVGGLFPKPT